MSSPCSYVSIVFLRKIYCRTVSLLQCGGKQIQYRIWRSTPVETGSGVCETFAEMHSCTAFEEFIVAVCLSVSARVGEQLYVCASSHLSLKVALGWVGCVGGGGVPVLIVQFHPVLLLPRHDGQLGGHVLEGVPGALVLWVWLVLDGEWGKGKQLCKIRCAKGEGCGTKPPWGWGDGAAAPCDALHKGCLNPVLERRFLSFNRAGGNPGEKYCLPGRSAVPVGLWSSRLGQRCLRIKQSH